MEFNNFIPQTRLHFNVAKAKPNRTAVAVAVAKSELCLQKGSGWPIIRILGPVQERRLTAGQFRVPGVTADDIEAYMDSELSIRPRPHVSLRREGVPEDRSLDHQPNPLKDQFSLYHTQLGKNRHR